MASMFERYSTPQHPGAGIESLFKWAPLNEREKNHLAKVYALVSCAVCVSALGVLFSIFYFSISPLVCSLAAMALMFYVSAGTNSPKAISFERLGAFFGLWFLMGMAYGPFLNAVNSLSPAIIPTALFGSISIFTCFSLAALFAKRRSFLYLGSILGSLLTFLMIFSLTSFLFRIPVSDLFIPVVSFLIYCGYVVYDTQLIVERFAAGNEDFIGDALMLFVDLFFLIIHLVRILAQKELNKKESKD